jgi:hypothetical protein
MATLHDICIFEKYAVVTLDAEKSSCLGSRSQDAFELPDD